MNDSGSKVGDVEMIDGGDVGSHGGTSGVENVSGEGIVVVENFSESLELVFGEGSLVADVGDDSSVLIVVGDDSNELGEVPSVPFSHSHGEGVDVLVELIEEGDSLNDHVVGSIDVELYFPSRVGVS